MRTSDPVICLPLEPTSHCPGSLSHSHGTWTFSQDLFGAKCPRPLHLLFHLPSMLFPSSYIYLHWGLCPISGASSTAQLLLCSPCKARSSVGVTWVIMCGGPQLVRTEPGLVADGVTTELVPPHGWLLRRAHVGRKCLSFQGCSLEVVA